MDVLLFMQYVENTTFDLYPEEVVSLELVIDKHGRLVKGPVFWLVDTGPGRLCSVDSKYSEMWEAWGKRMMQKGVIVSGLLPNSTSVSAVLDELFRSFKIAMRKHASLVYAAKIKAHAKAVRAAKIDIAQRKAQGEDIPEKELAKLRAVVTLGPADLGKILYGELDDKGYGSPDSPMESAFTKEKILTAHEKVSWPQINFLCQLVCQRLA